MSYSAVEFVLLKPHVHEAISKCQVVRLHSTGFDQPKQDAVTGIHIEGLGPDSCSALIARTIVADVA